MKNFFKPKKTFLTPQHKALDVMGLLDYTKKWQKGETRDADSVGSLIMIINAIFNAI